MLFFFRKVNEPVLLFDPNFNNVSTVATLNSFLIYEINIKKQLCK